MNKSRTIVKVVVVVVAVAALVVWYRMQNPMPTERSANGDSGSLVAEDGSVDMVAAYRQLCDAKALARKEQYAEALPLFEQIVKVMPETGYGWDADVQAALCMGYLDRTDEALTRVERVIADAPERDAVATARLARAEILGVAGEYDKAHDHLELIITDYTVVQPRFCEEALELMARLRGRQGHYALVRAALARLIEDFPGSEEVKRNMAIRQTARLRESVRERQGPRIRNILDQGNGRKPPVIQAGDNTWSAAGGPYLITEQVTIPSGSALTLEPGTVIRFAVDGQLLIQGNLNAAGTGQQQVAFLPLSDDPRVDWWIGIQLAEGANATLDNCRFVGTEIALHANAANATLNHCTLEHGGRATLLAERKATVSMLSCRVTDGQRVGVEARSQALLQMSECDLANLVTNGVVLHDCDPGTYIRASRITSCGWNGILLRGRCSAAVDHLTITGSGHHGINAIQGASPFITACQIENNTMNGIVVQENWKDNLEDSVIANNGGDGLRAEFRCTGRIRNNRFENNGATGIRLLLDCTPAIVLNRLVGNKEYGLLLEDSVPAELTDNVFADNGQAALRNAGPNAIDAAGNYWGTTDETKIAQLIEDSQENPDAGKVTFAPVLTEPPEMNPTR